MVSESHWWYLFHQEVKSWDSTTWFTILHYQTTTWKLVSSNVSPAMAEQFVFLGWWLEFFGRGVKLFLMEPMSLLNSQFIFLSSHLQSMEKRGRIQNCHQIDHRLIHSPISASSAIDYNSTVHKRTMTASAHIVPGYREPRTAPKSEKCTDLL